MPSSERPLVFVACTVADLQALTQGPVTPAGPAYAATPALLATFGYAPDGDPEEPDYAAQVFASLAGVLADRPRLVCAVEVDRLPGSVAPVAYGTVAVPAVDPRRIRAWFADEPAAAADRAALSAAWAGRTLEAAWDDPAVQQFVSDHDLLWYAPGEAADLGAQLTGVLTPDQGE
ncbi:DUF6912 family protein [Granulicoccus phenolivorans]|uniref:DUF6912 family protein n=1 Tax=Granulicoccus phenolivorans TaxID=266854 RepID=UPI000411DB82|nr:hypothetical protein [Granulicoccus phenolivorans]